MLELNLPKFDYRLEQRDGKLVIFDPIRKKFVVLTPEEWVRQHLVHFLTQEKGFPLSRTRVEVGLKYNNLQKRADILIYDDHLNGLVLVECKAPNVEVNNATLEQLAVYNSVCQARLIIVSNGLVHYAGLCGETQADFSVLESIPSLEELNTMR